MHGENVHGTRSLIALLPAIVVDFLDELIACIIADLLEELAEEMGEKSARGDNTLVRVRITIVQGHVSARGHQKTTNHRRRQECLASVLDLGSHILARQTNMRQILGIQEVAHLLRLVLHLGGVLKVLGQLFDRLLLAEDSEIGSLLEGSRQKRSHHLLRRPEDEFADLLVLSDSERAEEDHKRKILVEARHADQQRLPQTVELGGHADLELLGRRGKGLVKALHLDRVRVASLALLVLEDHDAVVGNLLLAENGALRPVNHEVPKGILGALAELREAHREVLEKAETRAEHHGDLAERDALEDTGLRLLTLLADREAEIGKHLSRLGVVANAGFHGEHRLHAPRGLRNTRLHLAHILERELELLLVLLGGLVELVVDSDGRRRLDDQRELVANEVLKALRLMRRQAANAISTEVRADCLPLHSFNCCSLLVNVRFHFTKGWQARSPSRKSGTPQPCHRRRLLPNLWLRILHFLPPPLARVVENR